MQTCACNDPCPADTTCDDSSGSIICVPIEKESVGSNFTLFFMENTNTDNPLLLPMQVCHCKLRALYEPTTNPDHLGLSINPLRNQTTLVLLLPHHKPGSSSGSPYPITNPGHLRPAPHHKPRPPLVISPTDHFASCVIR